MRTLFTGSAQLGNHLEPPRFAFSVDPRLALKEVTAQRPSAERKSAGNFAGRKSHVAERVWQKRVFFSGNDELQNSPL